MLNYLISWINGDFISRDEHDRIVGYAVDVRDRRIKELTAEVAAMKKKAADAARILQS